MKSWKDNRQGHQENHIGQLTWAAHVVLYVEYLAEQTKGGKKYLRKDVPLFGPRFTPPPFCHYDKRGSSSVDPGTLYLKPLTVVHPFYFPDLRQCPNNSDHVPEWEGWTPSGHRNVHGVSREETAIGYQLRCKKCERFDDHGVKQQRCWATTSSEYWRARGVEHWDLPRKSR